jgi:dTDP-4-dehydrorhamnose reductase
MRILLTGASGQLGRELISLLTPMGTVYGIDRDQPPAHCDERHRHDLSDFGETEVLLNRIQPQVIVNAAAFTNVDDAEEKRVESQRLNAGLPELLASWSRRNDSFLMHYSTDYVFDGASRRPYTEQDRASPVSYYGESKLAGEQAVIESNCRHVIIRSSWIYSGHGHNFLLTMLRLAAEHAPLKVVADQIGCPTWAGNLARVTTVVLRHRLDDNGNSDSGQLFHYCDGSVTSWHEFAQAIFAAAVNEGLLNQSPRVQAIATSEYPTRAKRPRYSVLDTSAIEKRFGIQPPGLESSLKKCIGELKQNV